MRFRKKPVVIEALQWTGNNFKEIKEFCPSAILDEGQLCIHTLEGLMYAQLNSWIIRGVKGEYYPCRGDIFYETYDAEE